MIIAVASSGKWLESSVDFHAGRAECFVLYNTEDENFEVIDNWKCIECLHWAGVRAAQLLAEAGVEAVIVRHIGPNTFRKLTDFKIGVFYSEDVTVIRAIRLFREGRLEAATEPNCNGHRHWG